MLTVVNKGDKMISKSTEEYLKTIYILKNNNEKITVTKISNILGCTKPSVTKQLNILKENNMISYVAYGDISLTNKGIVTAKKILSSYDIVYLLMKEIFKLESDKASIEADKVRAVLDDETLDVIARYVYKELGLDLSKCNYSITSLKCSKCDKIKMISKGSEDK